VLWARNVAFLWSRRRAILLVVGLAELWTLLTDPIGGQWGAWFFDSNKVLGLWLFAVMPIEDLLGMAAVSSAAACAVLVFGYGPRRSV
jgi:lycopene cyclase domain-containing protein